MMVLMAGFSSRAGGVRGGLRGSSGAPSRRAVCPASKRWFPSPAGGSRKMVSSRHAHPFRFEHRPLGESAMLRVVTYGQTSTNSIDTSPEAFQLLDSGEYP